MAQPSSKNREQPAWVKIYLFVYNLVQFFGYVSYCLKIPFNCCCFQVGLWFRASSHSDSGRKCNQISCSVGTLFPGHNHIPDVAIDGSAACCGSLCPLQPIPNSYSNIVPIDGGLGHTDSTRKFS